MQQSIARYAHRMHYGVGDTPGDALEVLLNELSDRANDADSGTTARGEIVSEEADASARSTRAAPVGLVDKAIEPRLLQHVPAQIVKQLEARDAIGSPKAQCDVLLARWRASSSSWARLERVAAAVPEMEVPRAAIRP